MLLQISNPRIPEADKNALVPNPYRSTSLTRNRLPVGPCSRALPRALW